MKIKKKIRAETPSNCNLIVFCCFINILLSYKILPYKYMHSSFPKSAPFLKYVFAIFISWWKNSLKISTLENFVSIFSIMENFCISFFQKWKIFVLFLKNWNISAKTYLCLFKLQFNKIKIRSKRIVYYISNWYQFYSFEAFNNLKLSFDLN